MCFKENILGCLSNLNKGKVNRCISIFGCQEYLLDNDCCASLVAVLTQIQYGSVSRSCHANYCDVWQPGLTLLRQGGTSYPLQIFALLCQNCSLFSSSSFTLNIVIKYN